MNAAISGGINIKAYDMLVKEAPNVEGSKWVNHEEFVAQAASGVLGEIQSLYYLVPLFGLNKTSIIGCAKSLETKTFLFQVSKPHNRNICVVL